LISTSLGRISMILCVASGLKIESVSSAPGKKTISDRLPIHPGNFVSRRFLINVFLKGLVLFLLLNLALVLVKPDLPGKVSLYNHVFPGRQRFPFGEDPAQSYNLSLFNLDAMFSSHIIASKLKTMNEYRIFVIGDSSVWGTLLRPEQTLTGQLNLAGMNLCGKTVRIYNLGYPTISLTKDLMVLDYAMRYSPDMVLWPLTLEAFPIDKQLSSPLVANNANRVSDLSTRYSLPFDTSDSNLIRDNIWDRTLIGQRRGLADLFRLQIYGVLWSATGIDQVYPTNYEHAQNDFDSDLRFHSVQPPALDQAQLAFEVLEAGFQVAGKIPVLIINEPILIGSGKNSDTHYNFFYPRWAYDEWREMMIDKAASHGWSYLDLWNIVPATDFTNSAIHLTPEGESILSKNIIKTLMEQTCQ
jgi:hypothetical protein